MKSPHSFHRNFPRSWLRPGLAAALSAPALAQQNTLHFTIDWKSPSISRLDGVQMLPITEGDILRPPSFGGTTGAPGIGVSGQALALQQYSLCQGHQPGTPCEIELDAISNGQDAMFSTNPLTFSGGSTLAPVKRRVWFSVDEYAQGSLVQTPPHPQVSTEGTPPVPFAFEAAADVFVEINLPVGPLPPGVVPGNNAGVFDGNGAASSNGFIYPGVGLLEPATPTPPSPPANPSDNIDGLDLANPYAQGTPVFFSLDSSFSDPRTSIPNNGSAATNGFVGGDVLFIVVGGPAKSLYANATSLGLDRVPPAQGGGPDSDDLDALIVHENGVSGFQASQLPYDWESGTTDMLIFSVRRGSRVIGRPDSIFGIPIEEGDLLTTPKPIALGGVSVFPGIFIAAENLGLATARTNAVQFGDDIDGLDYAEETCFDCNKNGVEDAVDIATGASSDSNMNGIPDECEDKVVEFCWCTSTLAPCGNFYEFGGCENSTGLGAIHTRTAGGVSVLSDDLELSVIQTPLNVSAIMFMTPSSKPPSTFYDGLKCTNSPAYRYALQNSGGLGTLVYGPGLVAESITRFPTSGEITAGDTWYFQCWYRDPTGPCGDFSNLSNVVRIEFEP